MGVFKFKQFSLNDNGCAMKVGTDGVLLGCYAKVEKLKNALDIGTGSGIIALMLAQRNKQLFVDAIDVQENAVNQAEQNFKNSPWANRFQICHERIQNYKPNKKYDLIVSNPPFFSLSPNSKSIERDISRDDKQFPLKDLFEFVDKYLSLTGKCCIIYPFDRLKEIKNQCKKFNFFIENITTVYPSYKKKPNRILITICKEKVNYNYSDILFIRGDMNNYTQEYINFTDDFYLNLQ